MGLSTSKFMIHEVLCQKYLECDDYFNCKLTSDIMYNETRHIVKLFNAALKRAVEATVSLKYLDFFDALLSDAGEKLAEGLQLDGTHLHPAYVALLERALPQ